MLRSILVALDGLTHSESAIELSIRWAKQFDAKIAGIGIIDQPMHTTTAAVPTGEGVPQMHGHWKNAAQRVELYVEQFSQLCQKAAVPATAMTDVGVPCERIVLEAQRHDLIVMSHHFETPESPGDTFTQVLQNSPRPIITVPKTLSVGDTIIIAYDGSVQSARALQILVATELCRSTSIHVVSIDTDAEAAMRLTTVAVDFLALHNFEAEVRPMVGTDPPADVLLGQIAELHAGLLVMGAHKKPILKEFFLGSVTKKILNESTIPLFLYH